MATLRFLGSSPPQAQVSYVVPANVSIGNKFSITVNGKTVNFVATAATVANVTAGLVTAIGAASDFPEFAEITATDSTTYLRLAAATSGVPFTATATAAIGTGPVTPAPSLTLSATLTTPVNDTFTTNNTGGSLSAITTYYYRVSAVNAVGETLASTETSIATGGGASTYVVNVNWLRVPGATGYRVYGRSTGAELYIGGVSAEATLTYADTGALTPSGALPGSNTTTISSKGPNHWDDTANWDTGALPVGGDTVYIQNLAVDILYGLDQNAVTLAAMYVDASFTGHIGLPDYTGTYNEYRDKFLKISVTSLFIGQGQGSGSSLLKINVGSVATTCMVHATATPSETGLDAAFVLRGTSASNVLRVYKGYVGVALGAGETSNLTGGLYVSYESNVDGDAKVRCGSGVTLSGVNQTGGDLTINSNMGTVTKLAGTMTINGTATVTTLNLDGGPVYDRSAGTITTLKIGDDGVFDASQDSRAQTITNCTMEVGSALKDPFQRITFTNPITLNRCRIEDVELDLGTSITLQRAAA